MYDRKAFLDFITESNRIEGILDVRPTTIEAHERFMALAEITIPDLERFCSVVTGIMAPLRVNVGQDVKVGNHRPPPGGEAIREALDRLLNRMHYSADPYEVHCDFETIHPFRDGNGRSGRVLWAWHMQQIGREPFELPFLHRWYYQSLNNIRRGL